MTLTLGIETSCDETAVAILDGERKILSDVVASQIEIHAPFGGIVPEIASRRHIEDILPLTEETLKKANITLDDIDAVAVTHTPGLVGSLLVGLMFAKGLAYSKNLPWIGVNHLEGHLLAPFLERDVVDYPFIGLVVSGGHTALYYVKNFGEYELMGATRDDAAGEAFDKVAKLLGLGYPGGPIIDKMAKDGDPASVKFTHAVVKRNPLDFSFSGIKTAVSLYVRNHPEAISPSPQPSPLWGEGEGRGGVALVDLLASFQFAVVEMLAEKTFLALEEKGCKKLLVSGGVACNSFLRKYFGEMAGGAGVDLHIASPKFCTDNAAMIAYVGAKRLARGERSDWSLNAIATKRL